MIRTQTFVTVFVVTALGFSICADVGRADSLADSPYVLETLASITGGDVGKHNSIVFSEIADKPYISYYDETNQDLRLIYPHDTAGNCGPDNEWYCEAPDTEGDVGQFSSIDYYHDSATGGNKIGIAYFDATNETLKAAVWSSSGWTVSTIDGGLSWPSAQEAGRRASLQFDSAGTVHIVHATYTSILGNSTESLYHLN